MFFAFPRPTFLEHLDSSCKLDQNTDTGGPLQCGLGRVPETVPGPHVDSEVGKWHLWSDMIPWLRHG